MLNGQLQWSACVLEHAAQLDDRMFPFEHDIWTCLLFHLVLLRLGSLRPTSSGDMLWTGIPLTSSTRSPLWMDDSRSGLRAAGSNLREEDNELAGGGRVGLG